MVSLSNHERPNFQQVGIFRSPFDKLRANGKILNLMAVTPERGNEYNPERVQAISRGLSIAIPPKSKKG